MILARLLLVWIAVLLPPSGVPAEGTFQGTVVERPSRDRAAAAWLTLQGRNHMLRKVEVSHAVIVFRRGIPTPKRKCDIECLSAGQEVLVTAQQDSSGQWRAKRIEILRLPVNQAYGPVAMSFGFTKLNPLQSM